MAPDRRGLCPESFLLCAVATLHACTSCAFDGREPSTIVEEWLPSAIIVDRPNEQCVQNTRNLTVNCTNGALQMQVSLLEEPFPLGSVLDVGNKSVTSLGPDIPSCKRSDIIPNDRPSVNVASLSEINKFTNAQSGELFSEC